MVDSSKASPRAHTLHKHDELIILQLVCENPSVYLCEIQAKLLEATGTTASIATICRALKNFGFSRKRLQFVALQRSDILIAKYQAEVSMYDSSAFVFVDETGCDHKDTIRRFGYSLRGFPAKSVTSLLLEVRGFQQLA